jgi:hypothetical protein
MYPAAFQVPGPPYKTPGLLSEDPSLVSTSTEVSNPWMNGEYPEMKTVTLSTEGLRIVSCLLNLFVSTVN